MTSSWWQWLKVKTHKELIQKEFRCEMGLMVDQTKPGRYGTTNDCNTARHFFKDPSHATNIPGLSKMLISTCAVILQTLSYDHTQNLEAFDQHVKQASECTWSLWCMEQKSHKSSLQTSSQYANYQKRHTSHCTYKWKHNGTAIWRSSLEYWKYFFWHADEYKLHSLSSGVNGTTHYKLKTFTHKQTQWISKHMLQLISLISSLGQNRVQRQWGENDIQ
jgi:hypothetical protein